MVDIKDKHRCCGCSSCAQRCPKRCITMVQDEEGFFYPKIDPTNCIDCKLCEKVCPILSPRKEHEPVKVFAAKNPDDRVRMESSSGGIFTMLAESVIRDEGVVFGAAWDKNWNVQHTYTESIEGLQKFRASKYVQSDINECYKQVELFLKETRKVLFSGTPCQIAGLKAFLHKDYDNLLSVECACHGVPSPGLWQKYLDEVSKGKNISSINHRDKQTGWRNYSVVMKYDDGTELSEPHDNNPWIRAFIKNLTLRPSCYNCAFKASYSQADITLADLWGDRILLPDQDEDKGITLTIVHSSKGENAVRNIEKVKEFTLMDVAPYNGAVISSPPKHPRRLEFMLRIKKGESFIRIVRSLTKDPFTLRVKLWIRKLLN